MITVNLTGDADANVAALRQAAAALKPYGTLRIGPANGSYPLSSSALASAPGRAITVSQSGVTIEGAGGVELYLTGDTPCGLLRLPGGDITVRRLQLDGGNIMRGHPSTTDGCAILCHYPDAGTHSGPLLEDLDLRDWTGQGWLWLLRGEGAEVLYPRIRRVTVSGGGDPEPQNGGVSAAAILISGPSSGTSRVYRPLIADCDLECSHIKSGVSLMWDVQGARLTNIVATNCGAASAAPPAMCYAVNLYGRCLDALISGCTLSAYTAPIYGVGCSRATVMSTHVTGQRETRDDTLLRGGVALGGPGPFAVRDCTVADCAIAVQLQSDYGGTVDGCRIEQDSNSNRATAVKLRSRSGGGGPYHLRGVSARYTGNASAIGLWLTSTDGHPLGPVYRDACTFAGYPREVLEYPALSAGLHVGSYTPQ